MNKRASVIVIIGVIVAVGIVFWGQSQNDPNLANTEPGQNIEMRDGIQYITINARGGYSPKVSSAQADIPTKLIVKTNGTYDCSASLVIRSIGYQKILPQTGEEIIDLGTSKTGTLRGLCSMGMYNFVINFKRVDYQL